MITDYKITHIGPFPPPLGGISVYLYRVRRKNPEYIFINENKLSKLKLFSLFFTTRRHFIYHSPSLKRRLFFYFLCLITKNKFSIFSHGEGLHDSYEKGRLIVKFLIKKMLHCAESIYVVNTKIKDFIINEIKINSGKIKVQPPFLCPPLEEEEGIWKTYNKEMLTFIKKCKPLLVANANRITFYNGIDLYGLDMCVDLVFHLKKIYPKIGFLFALAEVNGKRYYERVNKRIDELGIRENFCFMTEQKELWPLFKKADLIVRPTNADGDAVSIREALYFNCKVVASDVCERPKGTVLFRNRNIIDLMNKVKQILNNRGD